MTGALGHQEPVTAAAVMSTGLTVYGCEPDEQELFRELGPRFGILPTITADAVSEDAAVAMAGTRCVSVGHKSAVSEVTLRALRAAGVEHISTRSIGMNHIDLRAAARLGITVENTTYAPDGVADFTVMLLLMAIRSVHETVAAVSAGDFRLRGVRGRELCDLTVGVVGVGSIGAAVVRRLEGFGCRVLACDPRRAGAGVVTLDEVLRESDILTLHLPLDADTRHIVGRRAIQAMKPGAYLVNTGRGALVDTHALVVGLEAGQLGGAALDVLEGEESVFYSDCRNRRIDHHLLLRLQRLPNVVITPHTAYYTQRTLQDTVEQTLVKCLDFERRPRG